VFVDAPRPYLPAAQRQAEAIAGRDRFDVCDAHGHGHATAGDPFSAPFPSCPVAQLPCAGRGRAGRSIPRHRSNLCAEGMASVAAEARGIMGWALRLARLVVFFASALGALVFAPASALAGAPAPP